MNLTGEAEDVGLAYEVGRALANSTAWPQWQASSEFKPARDATSGQRR